MPTITARDGQALHVRVLGRGRPVLLLHGLGSSGKQWLPFLWPHLHRFRFHLPDFRGAGRSAAAALNQPSLFQNYMEDVEDIVRHFGLRDLLLGGYSLGATTSLHWLQAGGFARVVRRYLHIDQTPCIPNGPDWRYGLLGERQPEFQQGLRALLDCLAPLPAERPLPALPLATRQRVMQLLGRTVSELDGKRRTAAFYTGAARLPALMKMLLPTSRVGDLRTILASYLDAHDYRPSLRGCSVPITVMVGLQSRLYHPAGQMAIADYAPRARIVRFEKSGHFLVAQEPLKFAREFGRFLRAAEA